MMKLVVMMGDSPLRTTILGTTQCLGSLTASYFFLTLPFVGGSVSAASSRDNLSSPVALEEVEDVTCLD